MIEEGIKVLLLGEDGRRHIVTASKRMTEVGSLGVIDGSALCASDLGRVLKVGSRTYVLLRPSLIDILASMDRRAQVIVPKDSFQIPFRLDIGCGSRVLEGGVGSGALTAVLLRSVAPAGKVVSYELREDHAAVARRNVALTGLERCWELRIGDVCSAGIEPGFDAAALDMPNPWDAMDNIVPALAAGGHVCCYVPNANQLERAVTAMREKGLGEVSAFETLQREMVVHEGGIRPSFEMLGHTGYLAFGRKLR